jgi:general secretion pathway protein G
MTATSSRVAGHEATKETSTVHSMLSSHRARRADQRGFTLVELLIVVLILGILAAVVVFAVGGIQNRGRNASCTIEVREVRTAIEAYKAQNNNTNPANLNTLVTANLLQSAPSASTPSYAAGYRYNAANGTYTGGTCPTG